MADMVKARSGHKWSREELLCFSKNLERMEPSANALNVAENRYYRRDREGRVCEDWESMLTRVGADIASADNGEVDEELAVIFRSVMEAGLFFPNSPTLMNAGTPVQQLQACFVLPIEDSMESIFETLKHSALIQKSGGGVGYFIGKIRHKGAIVHSTGGYASGPLSFLSVYNKVSNEIRQGGRRRGASLATMNYDHPDIMDFIDSKRLGDDLTNFNISVRVDDAFMHAVENDEEYELLDPRNGLPVGKSLRAREVFERLAENSHLNGEPGLLFYDAINAENPTPHLGAIEATNPCLPGDTLILTSEGPRTIRECIGKQQTLIINGREYATTERGFFATGIKPLVRIRTKEGYSLRATEDHPVQRATEEGRCRISAEWKAAGELKSGDKVMLHNHRGFAHWNGLYGNGEGYLLGLLVGDGTMKTDKALLSIWTEDKQAAVGQAAGIERYPADVADVMEAALNAARQLPHRRDFAGWQKVKSRNEYRLSLSALQEIAFSLGIIPGNNSITPYLETATSSAFVRGFLRGFFDADGSVQGTQQKGVSIRLAQSDSIRLKAVQRMLARLGIISTIYRNRRAAGTATLRDARSGNVDYTIKIQHELVISGDNILVFAEQIGFSDRRKRKRIAKAMVDYRRRPNQERFTATVESVIPDCTEEVFDVQVPGVNSFDANGMVVHNCGEQPLLAYESCNLGSLNLARMLKKEGDSYVPDWEKIRLVSHIATIFLDRVIDRNQAPVEQIETIMKGNRKIGLGIMGLAQYLIWQGLPYNSQEGLAAAEEVMKEVTLQSKVCSWQLAEEKGVFPNYDNSIWDRLGLPQRNATTTTIAPTGSLSIFANASPSAEPLFGVGFARHIMDGRYVQVDNVFEGMWQDYMQQELPSNLRELIGEKGPDGIQDLEEIPRELRRLFLCAHDISPLEHIKMQTVLQRWVDNAVSKTINAPHDATLEDCREAFMTAWRWGVKGVTYYRDGSRENQVITSTSEEAKKEQRSEQGKVPRSRPETTFGSTTRKPIGFCGRLYVTVNKELTEDGEERVCEVFTSVGEEGCPPLSNALAKIISISIRAGVDIQEIVEKLREEKCPSCIMHPETTVLSCTDFIGQELAKASTGKVQYRLNAAGGPKNIRICPSCTIGYMIPDALCSYCDYCGYTTCG